MKEENVTPKGIALSNMLWELEEKKEKIKNPFKFAFVAGWTAMLEVHDKKVEKEVLKHSCEMFKYSTLRPEKLKAEDIEKFSIESFTIGWSACEIFYQLEDNSKYNELLDRLFGNNDEEE